MIVMNVSKVSFILGLVLGSFCAFGKGMPNASEIARLHVKKLHDSETIFDLNSLPVCSRYGCLKITNVSLTNEQWGSVVAAFNTRTVSAAKERKLLSVVIGQIEAIVGAKNNTHSDVGGTFNIYLNPGQGKSEQMDCIDESANTLLYLRILQQQRKLYWHDIYGLSGRGGIRAGYPHTAVLIIDKKTGQKYIIDSWFHDNGEPAEVVPHKVWKKGWKPGEKY
ncbi:MAG: hypothetical protein GKR92_00390 [Gammaproteobacteria bacterium]|nr:MAG: hypothetical protein GKR92_00390 [Gammaproteobacteria bacterium]